MKPCLGHADLYDIVLFDDAPSEQRQQAVHRAAALCATCPAQCGDKVTADSQPLELVLLDPEWMPPATEGRPEPEPVKAGGRRRKQDGPEVGQDYVPAGRRVSAWAVMAAERASLGHCLSDIAAGLCVTEDTARQLIAIGRGEHLDRPAA
ncbi:hypothetical protein AB0D42_27750 [Streptomyces sp. NPDC048304]|uniref:hypothetical protein n=1 Tax=Streptomyces sp. NPDC048304 TaxID=3154820 RepID=UPI0033D2A905